MSKEELFTIDIEKLDNPFEREKFLMLPQDLLVELLVRHLKREIKSIEYINKRLLEVADEELQWVEMKVDEYNKEYYKLLFILGGKDE